MSVEAEPNGKSEVVRCTCGRFLAEIEVLAGATFRQRLARCPDCHRHGRPATPILFVRDGRVSVINWRGRVALWQLPWPT